jgi:hypothetical protein
MRRSLREVSCLNRRRVDMAILSTSCLGVATDQKIACGRLRRLSDIGQNPRNPVQDFRIYSDASVFFPRPPRPLSLEDYEGEELPDKHATWREATVTAGQILQGLDGALTPAREWRMVVTDEFQNSLFVLHISAEKPR